MTKHTTRDRIWSAALETAEEYREENTTWSGFTAGDVAEKLENGASARSIRDTLATMVELGHLESHRKRGQYKPVARNESSSTKDQKVSSGPSIEESSAATTWSSAEFDDDQEDVKDATSVDVDDLDLPGGGSTLEARRDAVRACYEYLRENGTATKADFIEHLYHGVHTARYGSEGGWWNTIGKQGLRELARRRDDIEAPTEGGRIWEYVG